MLQFSVFCLLLFCYFFPSLVNVPSVTMLPTEALLARNTSSASGNSDGAVEPVCIDAAGRPYSEGALARIDGKVKRCEKGTWVVPPEGRGASAALKSPNGAKRTVPCVDAAGRPYSQGALARIDAKVKKCEKGKWVLPAEARSVSVDKKPAVLPVDSANPPSGCVDAARRPYSEGALARIDGKVKKCEKGKWVVPSESIHP